MGNTALVEYEELGDRNWVIFFGIEKYYITEKTKDAILDAVKRGLEIFTIDGVVWTKRFSRILPLGMQKESDYLKRGYRRSKKHPGKWYDPKVGVSEYF